MSGSAVTSSISTDPHRDARATAAAPPRPAGDPAARAGAAKRVALISPYGGGNLGDAAIMESAIHALRRRRPGAEIVGLTLNPRVVEERHGIRGFPCAGVKLSSYGAADADGPRPDDSGPLARLVTALPPLRKARTLGRKLRGELAHRHSARAFLAGFSEVVVAGGGQLDELWGGPFGHPYALWKWGQLAREVGARYLILSVGVGTLRSRLGQLFARRALALAESCSFRDPGSRQLASFADVSRAQVVPDLAYAAPIERPVEAPLAGRRPVLALSPLAYGDPRVWPEKDAAHYQHHLESMASLCRRMLALGWEIVLVSSDSPDAVTVRDVLAQMEPLLLPEERARVSTPETRTLPALVRALAPADVVVAARLHGVIISHVLGKPVLALSYERKVTSLMDGMEQQTLCLPIRSLDSEVATAKVLGILERREAWAADVRARVAAYRQQVEAQYDRSFGAADSASS
ncbi:MAG TPA: polysaccharide pyruvyl transferase family protein [Polyangia bacterium]|nr:polysaccharide pyruvyl transferase family protein [Polyangia bacterium]